MRPRLVASLRQFVGGSAAVSTILSILGGSPIPSFAECTQQYEPHFILYNPLLSEIKLSASPPNIRETSASALSRSRRSRMPGGLQTEMTGSVYSHSRLYNFSMYRTEIEIYMAMFTNFSGDHVQYSQGSCVEPLVARIQGLQSLKTNSYTPRVIMAEGMERTRCGAKPPYKALNPSSLQTDRKQ